MLVVYPKLAALLTLLIESYDGVYMDAIKLWYL